jgi:antitoxin PrlF
VATITSKGQVTIPKSVRELLGVRPGDRVSFRVDTDGRVVVETAAVDVRAIFGTVRPRRRGVSVEDMQEAVRRRGSGQ